MGLLALALIVLGCYYMYKGNAEHQHAKRKRRRGRR